MALLRQQISAWPLFQRSLTRQGRWSHVWGESQKKSENDPEEEGRAGSNSWTCGLERDLDPEFKSQVKIFRQTDHAGEPQHFSLGPKHTLSGPGH